MMIQGCVLAPAGESPNAVNEIAGIPKYLVNGIDAVVAVLVNAATILRAEPN
jgi:hypothetical protein